MLGLRAVVRLKAMKTTESPEVGAPAGDQLEAVDQSESAPPVQVSVAAWAVEGATAKARSAKRRSFLEQRFTSTPMDGQHDSIRLCVKGGHFRNEGHDSSARQVRPARSQLHR